MNLPALLALALLGADGPATELPYTPGLDTTAMDRTADPCVDFYAFACGGWQRNNPIPPEQAAWDVYRKASVDNQRFLWGILAQAAAKPDAERTPEERQVGDYFAACMDEGAIESAGSTPLAADLAAIDALARKEDVARLVGRLHRSVDGRMLFGFGSEQSFEDSEQVVTWVTAGGLGMADRDQYLKDDVRSRELRKAYEEHVGRMLQLSGVPARAAASGAKAVLRIETALARASLTRVEQRDPRKLWHRTPSPELAKATPAFRWGDYLDAVGAPRTEWVNVAEPAFLTALDRQLAAEPLSAWKTYLRWHLVRARAPYLSMPFQKEWFTFY